MIGSNGRQNAKLIFINLDSDGENDDQDKLDARPGNSNDTTIELSHEYLSIPRVTPEKAKGKGLVNPRYNDGAIKSNSGKMNRLLNYEETLQQKWKDNRTINLGAEFVCLSPGEDNDTDIMEGKMNSKEIATIVHIFDYSK